MNAWLQPLTGEATIAAVAPSELAVGLARLRLLDEIWGTIALYACVHGRPRRPAGPAVTPLRPESFLRPLVADDGSLLAWATLGTVNWCGDRFTPADVAARPEFFHYTRVVPERGDFGVVAEVGGRAVGVAWALYLPDDDPGYGHLDDATPEVSLWVEAVHRGQGLGRTLLQRVKAVARSRGVERMSLSVEDGNVVARSLYASEGFVAVTGRERDGVMAWPRQP